MPPGNDLTSYRLDMIEKTLEAISENLSKLAALEQKHVETREALGRAFTEIGEHNKRLRDVEAEMPTLKLVRGWVITGVLGVLGLLGLALKGVFGSHA